MKKAKENKEYKDTEGFFSPLGDFPVIMSEKHAPKEPEVGSQITFDDVAKEQEKEKQLQEISEKMPEFISKKDKQNSFISKAKGKGGIEYNNIVKALNDAKANPYVAKTTVLTDAESKLYNLMKRVYNEKLKCVNQSVDIFPKVRLADFIDVNKKAYDRSLFYAIASKHVDYLVCDGKTQKIIFAVELDDDFHYAEDRVQRDEFVNNLLKSVGIKLFRVDQKIKYVDESTLTDSIDYLLGQYAPVCPECGGHCTMQRSKKHKNYGHRFYGCDMWARSENPCHYTLDIE